MSVFPPYCFLKEVFDWLVSWFCQSRSTISMHHWWECFLWVCKTSFIYLFYTNRKCIFTSTILTKSCSHQPNRKITGEKKVFEQICSRERHFTEDQIILIVQSSCATWKSGVFYLNSTWSRWKSTVDSQMCLKDVSPVFVHPSGLEFFTFHQGSEGLSCCLRLSEDLSVAHNHVHGIKSNTEFCRIHMSVYDSEVYLYLYMFLFCFQDHHHGRLHDGPAQIPAGRAELHLGNRELWVMLSYMISTSRQRPWRLDAHAESEALGLMERLKTLNSRRTRRRAVAVNLLHLSLEFPRVWKVVVALRLQI